MSVALVCAVAWMVGLGACSEDEFKTIPAHTEAEQLWIDQNLAYFREKKELIDEGDYLYQRLVVEDDTLLYRVLEIGEVDSIPTLRSDAKVSMLGILPVSNDIITGDVNGNPVDVTLDLDSPDLIKGLSALLLQSHKGERLEAIIPYQLGYGDQNYSYPYIPLCSTLQFTITVKSFE